MDNETDLKEEESEVFVTEYDTDEWWVDLGGHGMIVTDAQADELIEHLAAFLSGTQGESPYLKGDELIVVSYGTDGTVDIGVANAWAEIPRWDAEKLLSELKSREKD